MIPHSQTKFSFSQRILSAVVGLTFLTTSIVPPSLAQSVLLPSMGLNLPAPGTVVNVTPAFTPILMRGVMIHPEDSLKFDFIIDKGSNPLGQEAFNQEANKLIKYFLASLTIPENEMWVNLSPYEKDRIIPNAFGQTEMGRDLLAQDYMLKQITASLLMPEGNTGRKFWERVHAQAKAKFGTTEVPMDTFNKIWIVPENAKVFENEKGAFVVGTHLKVLLEEDYIALEANKDSTEHGLGQVKKEDLKPITKLQTEVLREVIIPEIEKEVNEGETFANLRQIYYSMVLASWYKQALKESLLGKIYVDKSKTQGVDINDPKAIENIYNQYVDAFKKGVAGVIKEDYDPATQEVTSRKYVTGGIVFASQRSPLTERERLAASAAMTVTSGNYTRFVTKIEEAGASAGMRVDDAILATKEVIEYVKTNGLFTSPDFLIKFLRRFSTIKYGEALKVLSELGNKFRTSPGNGLGAKDIEKIIIDLVDTDIGATELINKLNALTIFWGRLSPEVVKDIVDGAMLPEKIAQLEQKLNVPQADLDRMKIDSDPVAQKHVASYLRAREVASDIVRQYGKTQRFSPAQEADIKTQLDAVVGKDQFDMDAANWLMRHFQVLHIWEFYVQIGFVRGSATINVARANAAMTVEAKDLAEELINQIESSYPGVSAAFDEKRQERSLTFKNINGTMEIQSGTWGWSILISSNTERLLYQWQVSDEKFLLKFDTRSPIDVELKKGELIAPIIRVGKPLIFVSDETVVGRIASKMQENKYSESEIAKRIIRTIPDPQDNRLSQLNMFFMRSADYESDPQRQANAAMLVGPLAYELPRLQDKILVLTQNSDSSRDFQNALYKLFSQDYQFQSDYLKSKEGRITEYFDAISLIEVLIELAQRGSGAFDSSEELRKALEPQLRRIVPGTIPTFGGRNEILTELTSRKFLVAVIRVANAQPQLDEDRIAGVGNVAKSAAVSIADSLLGLRSMARVLNTEDNLEKMGGKNAKKIIDLMEESLQTFAVSYGKSNLTVGKFLETVGFIDGLFSTPEWEEILAAAASNSIDGPSELQRKFETFKTDINNTANNTNQWRLYRGLSVDLNGLILDLEDQMAEAMASLGQDEDSADYREFLKQFLSIFDLIDDNVQQKFLTDKIDLSKLMDALKKLNEILTSPEWITVKSQLDIAASPQTADIQDNLTLLKNRLSAYPIALDAAMTSVTLKDLDNNSDFKAAVADAVANYIKLMKDPKRQEEMSLKGIELYVDGKYVGEIPAVTEVQKIPGSVLDLTENVVNVEKSIETGMAFFIKTLREKYEYDQRFHFLVVENNKNENTVQVILTNNPLVGVNIDKEVLEQADFNDIQVAFQKTLDILNARNAQLAQEQIQNYSDETAYAIERNKKYIIQINQWKKDVNAQNFREYFEERLSSPSRSGIGIEERFSLNLKSTVQEAQAKRIKLAEKTESQKIKLAEEVRKRREQVALENQIRMMGEPLVAFLEKDEVEQLVKLAQDLNRVQSRIKFINEGFPIAGELMKAQIELPRVQEAQRQAIVSINQKYNIKLAYTEGQYSVDLKAIDLNSIVSEELTIVVDESDTEAIALLHAVPGVTHTREDNKIILKEGLKTLADVLSAKRYSAVVTGPGKAVITFSLENNTGKRKELLDQVLALLKQKLAPFFPVSTIGVRAPSNVISSQASGVILDITPPVNSVIQPQIKGGMTLNQASRAIIEQVQQIYADAGADRNDENLRPIVIKDFNGNVIGAMNPNDVVFMINHRPDRALPLLDALTNRNFNQNDMRFDNVPNDDLVVVAFVEYVKKLFDERGIQSLYKPEPPNETISDLMVKEGYIQGRFAESNKGSHVTLFWDGKRLWTEEEYRKQNITLGIVPSEGVPDEKKNPLMKYKEVTDDTVEFLEAHRDDEKVFVVTNFATDIQGHVLQGDMERAKTTVLATDEALGRIRAKVKELGGILIVTADHGNVEEMFAMDDEGNFLMDEFGRIPSTQHSRENPVPFIIEGLDDVEFVQKEDLGEGEELGLANIGPTLLDIMGIKQGEGMSRTLLKKFSKNVKGPIVMVVRDGWGINRFNTKDAIEGDAIQYAKPPVDIDLMAKNPWMKLKAHGSAVGLPEKQSGDSDNGHTTMGAGRIIPTEYGKIMADIKSGAFKKNKTARENIQRAMDEGRDISITGLLSEGGVHSHSDYVIALLQLAAEMGFAKTGLKIKLHVELDGRDVMTRIKEQSGAHYLEKVLDEAERLGLLDNFVIGSVNGRALGMDRDGYNGEKKGATAASKKIWIERFAVAYYAKFGMSADAAALSTAQRTLIYRIFQKDFIAKPLFTEAKNLLQGERGMENEINALIQLAKLGFQQGELPIGYVDVRFPAIKPEIKDRLNELVNPKQVEINDDIKAKIVELAFNVVTFAQKLAKEGIDVSSLDAAMVTQTAEELQVSGHFLREVQKVMLYFANLPASGENLTRGTLLQIDGRMVDQTISLDAESVAGKFLEKLAAYPKTQRFIVSAIDNIVQVFLVEDPSKENIVPTPSLMGFEKFSQRMSALKQLGRISTSQLVMAFLGAGNFEIKTSRQSDKAPGRKVGNVLDFTYDTEKYYFKIQEDSASPLFLEVYYSNGGLTTRSSTAAELPKDIRKDFGIADASMFTDDELRDGSLKRVGELDDPLVTVDFIQRVLEEQAKEDALEIHMDRTSLAILDGYKNGTAYPLYQVQFERSPDFRRQPNQIVLYDGDERGKLYFIFSPGHFVELIADMLEDNPKMARSFLKGLSDSASTAENVEISRWARRLLNESEISSLTRVASELKSLEDFINANRGRPEKTAGTELRFRGLQEQEREIVKGIEKRLKIRMALNKTRVQYVYTINERATDNRSFKALRKDLKLSKRAYRNQQKEIVDRLLEKLSKRMVATGIRSYAPGYDVLFKNGISLGPRAEISEPMLELLRRILSKLPITLHGENNMLYIAFPPDVRQVMVPITLRSVKTRHTMDYLIRPDQHYELVNQAKRLRVILKRLQRFLSNADKASIADSATRGGIDLNPTTMNMQIERDGNGVPLPVNLQNLENLNIQGFQPVIINVVPITNLPLLLGLNEKSSDEPIESSKESLSVVDRFVRNPS